MDPRSQQTQATYDPGAAPYVPDQQTQPNNQPAPGMPYGPQQDFATGGVNLRESESVPRQQNIPQPLPMQPQPMPDTAQYIPDTPDPAEQYQQQYAPQPQYASQPQQQTSGSMPQPPQLQAVQNQYDVRQFAAQPNPSIRPVEQTQPIGSVLGQPTPVVSSGQPNANPSTTPVARTNPNSTQNMLQVAEIRDGIVIMNDGSYRSVVMIKSINFDLMSTQEQEAVESGYQSFLNSLYFPMQIFIRSQKVDLQPYIDKLDKIRSEHDNMLLALLMDDYIGYIDTLAQQTNIMDKKFYIVIPFFPVLDVQKALSQSKNFVSGIAALFNNKEQHVVINEADLESAKTELRNRVQAVLAGLMQCGIQGLPLDTQELIELFYDTYNPDTATRQQLKNFNNMTADVITKGNGAATQPHLQRELG